MTCLTSSHLTELRLMTRIAATAAGAFLLLTGCGADTPVPASPSSTPVTAESSPIMEADTANSDHPDVLDATLESDGSGSWQLAVTMSSQYDTPERYADGWRVLDNDGAVIGEHTLTHDHAAEQPFTRTQSGLEIPDDVNEVTIEGRDTDNGFGGKTLTIDVPR